LLPSIEQQALYDRFDIDAAPNDQPDGDATQITPPVFHCPSDLFRNGIYTDGYVAPRRYGKGNYAAFASPTHLELQNSFRGAIIGRPQPLADIKDGVSNTLAIAEVRKREIVVDQRGAWALPFSGASLLAADAHSGVDIDALASVGKNAYSGDFFFAESSRTLVLKPNYQGVNYDTVFNDLDAVASELDGMACKKEFLWQSAAPRSRHLGGVVSAFLDGHVAFVTNHVDDATFAYLIAIDDSQPVDLSELK
jgi:prepilin-type processing-associated H-X9-DG protein